MSVAKRRLRATLPGTTPVHDHPGKGAEILACGADWPVRQFGGKMGVVVTCGISGRASAASRRIGSGRRCHNCTSAANCAVHSQYLPQSVRETITRFDEVPRG